ncbi:MAG: DMT family transporter, partial [Cyanobacteria bacterium P01_E01_bin.42]
IFTTLGGWLLFGQYFERKFLLGVAITILGSIAISLEDWQSAGTSLIGDGAALFSAIAYSIRLLTIERLRDRLSTTKIIFWISLITMVSVIPTALLLEGQLFPRSGLVWLAVILQGVLCEVIGQGAVAYSLKTFSSGFVSLFLLLEPVFAAILAWFIFSQALGIGDIFIFPVILLGIYLAQSSEGAEKNTSSD